MDEQKIRQIWCAGCSDDSCGKCKAPPKLKENCQKGIKALLALIAEDREKHNTLRWHTAKKHYDDGVETQEDRDILSGLIDTLDCAECMKQAKLAFIEREAGLVEALKDTKKDLELIQSGEGPYNRDPLQHLENCYNHMIEIARGAIYKIDAAIEGRGK